jgi:hypothetical protein
MISLACCADESASDTTSGPPPVVTTTAAPGSSTTTAPATTTVHDVVPQVVIEGGEVVGGAIELEAETGTEVVFQVLSDQPGQVHVHGYDLFFDLVPHAVTEVRFTAEAPGIFDIELEGSHTLLVELIVG